MPTADALRLTRHTAIAPIAAAWDQLVPRQAACLRAGMLQAMEESGVLEELTYLTVHRDDSLVAVAVVYTLQVDDAELYPGPMRRLVERIRLRHPRFMRGSMRVCGSPISNASSGIYFSPELSDEERQRAMDQIAAEVIRQTRNDQTIYIHDFRDDQVEQYAHRLETHGFFPVEPAPGTYLKVEWDSFDDYLGALARRYRRRIRRDMRDSSSLDFELLDSFDHLASPSTQLYMNVVGRCDRVLERLNESFFVAISRFDQAKLLVAREKDTGELRGVNLLMFGEDVMQNLYIGFDYQTNERHRTYFSLVQHSLRLAMEHGCRMVELGSASYEYKARLGAVPFRLTGYMKHPLPPIHWLLRASRKQLFPKQNAVQHAVFQHP